jgi:hypothetical protein
VSRIFQDAACFKTVTKARRTLWEVGQVLSTNLRLLGVLTSVALLLLSTTRQAFDGGSRYLTVPLALPPEITRRIRLAGISVSVVSHDQGWSDNFEDHGTFNGSWTWGEVLVEGGVGHGGGGDDDALAEPRVEEPDRAGAR